jgi:hypothetical protein
LNREADEQPLLWIPWQMAPRFRKLPDEIPLLAFRRPRVYALAPSNRPAQIRQESDFSKAARAIFFLPVAYSTPLQRKFSYMEHKQNLLVSGVPQRYSASWRMFENAQTRLKLSFSQLPLGIITILIIGVIPSDPG